jgi:outer membrane protein
MGKRTWWMWGLGGLALGWLVPLPNAIAAGAKDAKSATIPKVAVVDMQRAALETEDGLRAQATLKKYYDRQQMILQDKQGKLIQRQQDIEAQSKVVSREATQRAAEAWQKDWVAFQGMAEAYDKELQQKRVELTEPIYIKVSGLIRKLSQRDGYQVILERQAVPYVRGEYDVTDKVIVMYNSGEEPAPPEPSKKNRGKTNPATSGAPVAPKGKTPAKTK